LVINETNNLKFSPNKCFLTEQTKFDENFSYEGEIKNSKKHGKGKLILIDPDPELNFTFEGNFKNDILINGSLRTKSIYYEGEFGRNLLFHGNGQMHHLNSGEIYVGKFKDGFPHGNGKWIYSDGDEYVGVFNKGKFSDPGRNEFLEKKAIEEQNSVDNSVDTMIQDVFDERRKKKQAELLTICIDYYEMCKLIVTNGVTGSGRLGPQGICKKCGFVD